MLLMRRRILLLRLREKNLLFAVVFDGGGNCDLGLLNIYVMNINIYLGKADYYSPTDCSICIASPSS